MVNRNVFPVERLGELTVSWQELVKELILTHSQRIILERNELSEWKDLFNLGQLTPEAECVMLSGADNLACIKREYMGKYMMANSSFKYLLKMSVSNKSLGESYVYAHISKWKMTEEQYLLLMQSQYADKAPYWRFYVHN